MSPEWESHEEKVRRKTEYLRGLLTKSLEDQATAALGFVERMMPKVDPSARADRKKFDEAAEPFTKPLKELL